MSEPSLWPAAAVELRPVAALIPYAKNARKHGAEQVEKLVASIREWGFTVPLLIAEDGDIIAGHGRLLAAKQLGLEAVPCMVAEGWSEAKKRLYRVADNRLAELSSWETSLLKDEFGELLDLGADLDLTGFDAADLAAMMRDDDPLDFSGEGDTASSSGALNLTFGKRRIAVTADEVTALEGLLKRYVDENGMEYGFASYLIEGRR